MNKKILLSQVFSVEIVLHKSIMLHMWAYLCLTQTLIILQAAEKFKAPQPAPVIPEAKAATIEQEEESDEEEVHEGVLIILTIALASLVNWVFLSCHFRLYNFTVENILNLNTSVSDMTDR